MHPPIRATSALTLLALLAGCAVGPRYVAPDIPEIQLASPAGPRLTQADTQAAATPWWTFFDDERLTQWIALALAHNHDIAQAQANLRAARAIFDERRLDELPGVTAGASRRISSTQQMDSQGEPARQHGGSWRAGFDMQWEIDLFGRLDRLTQAAQARAQASAAELDAMRLSVAAEVARAYVEAQGLRKQQAVAQADLRSWQETVRLAQARLATGAGAPEELESARSNLLRSEAALPPLAASLQQARYRLDVLTGQRPGHDARPLGDLPTDALSSRLPLGDVDHLLRNRPDVRQAERLLAARVEDVGAATADLYPRISLGGFIGFFALRDADLGGAARALELDAGLTWPALRLGNARARLRGTQALADGAQTRYQQTLLLAQEEVEGAITALTHHQRRLDTLLRSARHAQTAHDIAGKRYQAGAGSYLAVLETQRTLLQIRQDIAAAETASYVDVVALYKALGWHTPSPANGS